MTRTMSRHTQTGRDATETEFRDAERVLSLTPIQQRGHPSAMAADHSKLSHINTYGSLPEFYLDQPFTCRKCGKREIWKARDQKWYYEEAKVKQFLPPRVSMRVVYMQEIGRAHV